LEDNYSTLKDIVYLMSDGYPEQYITRSCK